PLRFFDRAAEVLRVGGRLVLIEPAATPVARPLYGLFHAEPMRRRELAPPFTCSPAADGSFANMGMAVALFVDHRAWTEARLAEVGLRLVELRFSDPWAYPLSGGYSGRQLAPTSLLRLLTRLEDRLPPVLHRLLGWRLRVVLEKA
ncbi:MAG: hypothetical protein ACLFU2_05735, partial [Opitutales bacterium]